jgi:hypothetical protein
MAPLIHKAMWKELLCKIPLGRVAFPEVVYLCKFTIMATVAVCILIIICMLTLVGIKLVVEPFFGKNGTLIVVWLINIVLFIKYRCRYSKVSQGN